MSRCIFVLLVFSFIAGCSTLGNGKGWGEDVTLRPGWKRLGNAFLVAGRSPGTWAPLAGALLFQVEDWDQQLSDWASRQTPVFGSQATADEWSTDLANSCQAFYYLTALALPSGEKPQEWTFNKLKGFAVGYATAESVSGATSVLKTETARQRPNSANQKSFPSGHTSRASAYATLAARNSELLPLPGRTGQYSRAGLYTLVAATGWARVEAKVHYPSDVLAGAALGHFLSLFLHDSLMGLNGDELFPQVALTRESMLVGLTWRY